MTYQVLARKWRPQYFAEMVGQPHVLRALTNALTRNQLHHAYLFTGTRGVGKTTIARILAKSLNCELGITPTPCGQCKACQEIEQGRFVDLIEVDAASRTSVEDTRELLESVQYAPTRGRFKVYLIDEVHMLSTHSFNALLKTLEEPPAHIKFLLATTDPQKLPPTVLSRCLQFHLKRLPTTQMVEHLTTIVQQEQVDYELPALQLLAEAAEGSVRDALSLLDQAIAYGGGQLVATEVQHLLGTLDQQVVVNLVSALAQGDAASMLGQIAQLAEGNPDFSIVLADILSLLQDIAIAQVLSTDSKQAIVSQLAQQLSPETVQLFYQIGLLGRRDLALAPDIRGGFEMVMLRMLAFCPEELGQSMPVATIQPQQTTQLTVSPEVPPTTESVDDTSWTTLIQALKLTGPTKVLAENCELRQRQEHQWHLVLTPNHASFLNEELTRKLEQALQAQWGDDQRLQIEIAQPTSKTPAEATQYKEVIQQTALKETIEADPFVVQLKTHCDAKITQIEMLDQQPISVFSAN